jgi:DNA-binding LacI/PurR family transcriptional regulator
MLIHRMHSQNPAWVMRMHLGGESTTPLPHLKQEAFARALDLMDPDVLPRLRGVFTFIPLFELADRLHDAGVPVVNVHKGRGRHIAYFDERACFQDAAAFAQRQGYRRVGVVARFDSNDHLTGLLRGNGAEVREAWRIDAHWENSELVAFEALSRIWRSGEDRPEALIVGEDVACRGVLRAAGQLGIRLGTDLKLLTVAIRGIELPWHSPVTRYEFDPSQLIDAAASQMNDLLHGRVTSPARTLVPATFVPGATT